MPAPFDAKPARQGDIQVRFPHDRAGCVVDRHLMAITTDPAAGRDSNPNAESRPRPVGVTAAPFIRSGPDVSLHLAKLAQRSGCGSFWVAEVTGTEAFTTLGAVAASSPSLSLGTGVLAMQLRPPTLLAMAAATLQALAPDADVLLGVGVSSPVVASNWHSQTFSTSPIAYAREFLALLRECLAGEPVTFEGDFFSVRRFRLGVELGERRPQIILGALNRDMLRLGGAHADGVLLNYLPAEHVPWCVDQVRAGGQATIYANVHVGVTDRDAAAPEARRDLFSYIVVDSYARSFRAAGFHHEVDAVLDAHAAGDRTAALAAISDRMLDAISITGTASTVTAAIAEYRHAGVDVPVVFPVVWGAPDRTTALEATLDAINQ